MREWLDSILRPEVSLVFLAVLRILVGAQLLWQGYDKVQQGYFVQEVKKDEFRPNPLNITLENYIDDTRPVYSTRGGVRTVETARMFSWYQTFLENAVLPNARVFAMIVTAGELAVGFLLVVGLLVRVAAVFGFLLILNYLFATWHYGFPYQTLNILFLGSMVVFLLAAAGRSVGLDAWLHERFPEIPLF